MVDLGHIALLGRGATIGGKAMLVHVFPFVELILSHGKDVWLCAHTL